MPMPGVAAMDRAIPCWAECASTGVGGARGTSDWAMHAHAVAASDNPYGHVADTFASLQGGEWRA